jgi:trk system potassium uptake protein TrkH
MRILHKPVISFTPVQSLLSGFIVIILIGSILLALPISSSKGICQPFIDALFTATSAVTTTGLVVVDTGSYYSLFGQMVILVLFQIGGLGYMIFIALMVMGLGGRLSLGSQMLLHESLSRPTSVDIIKFSKAIIIYTLFFEFTGTCLLSLCWIRHFPIAKAVYLAIFHSVSAFCTAGFGLFSDSFSSYKGSIALNLVINVICIAGGIGFFVLYDVRGILNKFLRRQRPRRLSVHTKFVLALSILLMVIGTGAIYISEGGFQSSHFGKKLLSSAFQSISASTTTGFNTVDIGAMTPASLLTIIALMFIGASPGGTGGGIKTTSFGIMILFLIDLLMGRENVNLFKRRIPFETINKVFAIGFTSVLWVMLVTVILTATEGVSFLNVLFEAVSALGTVGLSTGITQTLSNTGRIFISITMLIGRMGPLAIGFSLIGRTKRMPYKYAAADVLVG